MTEASIRDALDAHWRASAAGDLDAEHAIYADDAICDYPQSGERIVGRANLQALRSHHPDKPSGFNVRRIQGEGPLWVTEYIISYNFCDPFDAPAWRSQWVARIT
ncbi:SnoaL-like protein [Paraburkholderia unamae]|uniref:nuclear transport factor 2 family protein n=1 Tax=Paraburkholderia unamae TaxID=219649 RepID=UPI001CB66AD3|nr:nuclear transport factor 2 family protein [Paraburkholderia unamae]CAG9274857.1 SnoaL-like protein [Paraburkholderia unamae]